MDELVWDNAWETGVQKIDLQHQEMFSHVERLFRAVRRNEPAEGVLRLLVFLVTYVEAHFRDEEAEMEVSGYPGLLEHRATHDDLRNQVSALVLQFRKDPTVLVESISGFFVDRLVSHINTEDRRMAAHLIQWYSACLENVLPDQCP